jgi:23S rRNA (cytidine1920-2'-O)/16S rRNA (cytidine1409-2'-O)-methyltransferase
MAGRIRLDQALVERGLHASRSRDRDAVLRGSVSVDGVVVDRPAAPVGPASRIEISDPAAVYVSRAAVKLLHAIEATGFDPSGRIALDIGASTGGFTQVLLGRGAPHVFALDVGHGQLDPRLAADRRVTNLEGINARDLTHDMLSCKPIGFLAADVSFISLRLALPAALEISAPGAFGIFLVKPQFEVGREHVGKGGIVRDGALALAAAEGIAAWLEGLSGWRVDTLMPSPIAGGDGNSEFLLAAHKTADGPEG